MAGAPLVSLRDKVQEAYNARRGIGGLAPLAAKNAVVREVLAALGGAEERFQEEERFAVCPACGETHDERGRRARRS